MVADHEESSQAEEHDGLAERDSELKEAPHIDSGPLTDGIPQDVNSIQSAGEQIDQETVRAGDPRRSHDVGEACRSGGDR